jgi:hypothetical protein
VQILSGVEPGDELLFFELPESDSQW